MDADKLEELERLLSEGTKPPLEVKVNRAGNPTIGPVGSEGMIAPWIVSDEDAALIVAAINALPELVAMARRDLVAQELRRFAESMEPLGAEFQAALGDPSQLYES
jgi:hypothetical protein